jgi:hypothetical protein
MQPAHAVNLESLDPAVKLGTVSFIPKDELNRLPELVAETFQGLEEGKNHWARLFEQLGPCFKEKVGLLWEDIENPPYPQSFYCCTVTEDAPVGAAHGSLTDRPGRSPVPH